MKTTCIPQWSASVTQSTRRRLLGLLAGVSMLSVVSLPAAAAQPDASAAPEVFVQQVADQALQAIQRDEAALQQNNVRRINELVDQYVLPYVDFEKTTRLAVGRYWRQADATQREALVDGFRGTLVRTYSGALRNATNNTSIRMMPFRGDASADDVVVRTQVMQSGQQPVGVDYRLERTPQGWRVYDLSVEGVWLIQNYRNQFAQQIQQGGIDGLIRALRTQTMAATN